ncbi:tRNA (adenosine(37)-N6)-threonylcarbamoyltransferase complex ATPase subunit type 1 TsaE [Aquabacterium lacunae]|uniref:tRNA threonylcarbamoyladenosine biosynthesis protein TsaE n=1 Tax=Aquabacterium lacunae TaxID=2528630 RepID=A0A4Q9H623_9BURK|nr:tRNA (adenosine(37)-N6)-threonylcarbamoyltransferase complex ATPase subunit type 1 TsaE [Aquabacterium lacunae]TBO34107.1 tRNA (adenosine(37)-N6)-threonylcarbamoyltransferase complex ATPase subunit type 1 TsaE [Aquabacterium lacunae]
MHVTTVARAPQTGPDARPAVEDSTVWISWPNEAECERFARQLAGLLRPALAAGDSIVIELRGTLGAGKTTFTRHLLRALGVQGRIKSPSYAVVEPHEAEGLSMWHFDFYRFNDPQEWEDAGFRDLFASPGLKLVEWPDHAAGLLPPADLALHLAPQGEHERHVSARAGTAQGRDCLTRLHDAGWGPMQAPAHASAEVAP